MIGFIGDSGGGIGNPPELDCSSVDIVVVIIVTVRCGVPGGFRASRSRSLSTR